MKQGSTHFLRAVVVILGLVALTIGFFALPWIYNGWNGEYPNLTYLRYPVVIGLAATILPFFAALFQALKLLDYLDRGTAFSDQSVAALRLIKFDALAFSALYALGLPVAYLVTQHVDAPGLMVIAMVMVGAPVVIAVFAAVLQRILRDAIDIKSENDLTV